jgi:outer membrane protein OmpA-like peptidoglycan-associated protein
MARHQRVQDNFDQCPHSEAGATEDNIGCETRRSFELRGVNFASNSDRLLGGAEKVLDDAIEWLARNPHRVVEVAGHTDSDGAPAATVNRNRLRETARPKTGAWS